MPHWPRADACSRLSCANPHLRCGGRRHRFGVAGVHRQRRRRADVREQFGDHRPLTHAVVPVQRVLGKLAATPHFFQLRLFVRPASLALHVNVDTHGFSLHSEGKPENDQKLSSDSKAVLVASVVKNVCTKSPIWVTIGDLVSLSAVAASTVRSATVDAASVLDASPTGRWLQHCVDRLQTSRRPENFAQNNCVAQTRFRCKQGGDIGF